MANHEILRESDKTTLTSQPDNSDSIFAKIAREAYVIGAGTVGGAVKEGWRQAAEDPWGSGLRLASSVGIGLALGYAQRGAGLMRLGGQAFGAALGVSFMADVMAPGRWHAIKDSLADTWHSGVNMDRNVRIMENNAGRFAFDTGMMLGGAMVGAKIGQRLPRAEALFKTNPIMEGPAGGAGALALAEAKIPAELRLGSRNPFEMDISGRRFGADKKGGEASIWDKARDLTNVKKTYGLEDLKSGLFQRDQLVAKDAPALELRTEIAKIGERGAALKTEISKLEQDLAKARGDVKAAQELIQEHQAVKRAQGDVEALKQQARELPAKVEALKALEQQIKTQTEAKKSHEGEGGKKGKGGKGDKQAEAPKEDLRGKARDLREEISRIQRDVNESDANSAINRARVRQAEAEQALAQAKEAQPQRITELETRVKEIEEALTGKKSEHEGLGEQLKQAIDAFQGRVKELTADASKLVEQPAGNGSDTGNKAEVKATRPAETRAADSSGTGTAAAKEVKAGAPKPEVERTEVVAEKPVEVVRAPEVLALEAANKSLTAAREAVTERAQKIELMESAKKLKQRALREIEAIEKGQKKFETEEAKEAALEAAKKDKAKADSDLAKVGKVQYFRPMNMVNEYAKAAENYLAAEPDAAKRDAFSREARRNLEDLLSGIPNSRKGARGQKDLQGPGQARNVNDYKRIGEIREHLDKRLGEMNIEHTARVSKHTEVPVVKEAFEKVNSGAIKEMLRQHAEATISQRVPRSALERYDQLKEAGQIPKGMRPSQWWEQGERARVVEEAAQRMYDNATIGFFEKGMLVQNRGSDGQLHQQFFDVAKVEKGQGRPDRLINHVPEGYFVAAPVLKPDGTLFELSRRGGKSGTYAKEVLEIGGAAPENVGKGTSLGEILKKFKGEPKPVQAAKPAEQTAETTATDPAVKTETETLVSAGTPITEATRAAQTRANDATVVAEGNGQGSAYEAVAPKAVEGAEVKAPETVEVKPAEPAEVKAGDTAEVKSGDATTGETAIGKTETGPEGQ